MTFLGGRPTLPHERVINGVAPPGKVLESTQPASSEPTGQMYCPPCGKVRAMLRRGGKSVCVACGASS